jgi:hypothetical protein
VRVRNGYDWHDVVEGPYDRGSLELFYLQAKSSRASRSGTAIVFGVSLPLLVMLGLAISTLVVVFVTYKEPRELWLNILGATLILAMCLAWPSSITVDQSGVTSKVWWRRRSRIGWDAVVDLERNIAGDMKVYGSDGATISFSRYHVDPDRFEAEVLRRGKLRRATSAEGPESISSAGK